jgi:putative cell wall-binding protein
MRLAGDDRYATAAAVALSPQFASDTCGDDPDVIIVNGENYPDGLAAAVYGDRVLLVKSDSIPAATHDAIVALMDQSQAAPCLDDGDVDLEIIGGPNAVSPQVEFDLQQITNGTGGDIDYNGRIWGADRYETALAVAGDFSADDCFILATGENFPDALAAGPLAEEWSCPILLNRGSSLLANVKAYIDGYGAEAVYIVGGESAVPASVETEILSMGINVERFAGDNRFETAAAIAAVLADDDNDHSVVLVNGNSFADALAAGPFASLPGTDGAILLTNSNSIPTATAGFHVANCATLGEDTGEDYADVDPATTDIYGAVIAVGGTAVVSDGVLAGAGAATKCGDDLDVASVTVAQSGITEQACIVTDDDGIWNGLGSSPILVPTPGGAASGLDPLIDIVTVSGTGTAADLDLPNAEFTGKLIQVDLGEELAGMTQERFAEIWASIPEAAATFIVVPADPNPFLNDPAGSKPISVSCSPTSFDLTVVVTFNQPVGTFGSFGTTPAAPVGNLAPLPPVSSASPLFGAPDADGNTVFTYVWDDVPESLIGMVPEVGDTFELGTNEVQTSAGASNAEMIEVVITAG